jgi:hypothetical protein
MVTRAASQWRPSTVTIAATPPAYGEEKNGVRGLENYARETTVISE